MQYLTQPLLFDICKQVFNTNYVEVEYKIHNKKYDICVLLNKNFKEYGVISHLLFEFDGHFHYNDNRQVITDKKGLCGFSNWKQTKNILGIRIPYFIQLDEYFSKYIFDINYKLNDYENGFIDKNCKLPNIFTNYGEKRFIFEIQCYPNHISKTIIKSLTNKAKKYGYSRVCSYDVWEKLYTIDNTIPLNEIHTEFFDLFKNAYH